MFKSKGNLTEPTVLNTGETGDIDDRPSLTI